MISDFIPDIIQKCIVETKKDYCGEHNHHFINELMHLPNYFNRYTNQTEPGNNFWTGCDKCRIQNREIARDKQVNKMLTNDGLRYGLDKEGDNKTRRWIPDLASPKFMHKNDEIPFDKPSIYSKQSAKVSNFNKGNGNGY